MKTVLLLLLMISGISNSIYGQNTIDYNSLPKEIQQKMNQNKREGKSTFYGINKSFTVVVGNLDQKNIDQVINSINSNKNIIKHIISADRKSIQFTTLGDFQIEDIKKIIGQYNVEIINYNENFILEK